MRNNKDELAPVIEAPVSFTGGADNVKLKSEDRILYQCVVCHQIRESVPGQKIGFYIKETLGGTEPGPICPDCEKKQA